MSLPAYSFVALFLAVEEVLVLVALFALETRASCQTYPVCERGSSQRAGREKHRGDDDPGNHSGGFEAKGGERASGKNE